jgi:hypothetical protein
MIEPQQVVRQVGWRLVPFLTLLYFFNFIERVNVGFAAPAMNAAIDFRLSGSVGTRAFSSSAISFSRCRASWRSTASAQGDELRVSW